MWSIPDLHQFLSGRAARELSARVGITAQITQSERTDGHQSDGRRIIGGKGMNDYIPMIDDRQGLNIIEHQTVTLDLRWYSDRASVTFRYIVDPYSPMAQIVGLSGYPRHWSGGNRFCRYVRKTFRDATGRSPKHLEEWINAWLDSKVIEL